MITVSVLFSESAIGTQVLLTNGRRSVLVDVGDGTLRDLAERGFDFDTLAGIVITHEHFDHTGGLFSLLHFMRHLPRKNELPIFVPRPADYVPALLRRPLMYKEPDFGVPLNEVRDGGSFGLAGMKVLPFKTDHGDTRTLGYSFQDSKGFRVVVSGDTKACRSLKEQVRGADLAVIESTFEDGQREHADAYGHMTRSEARMLGKLAKKAIYYHAMPQNYFAKMTCSDLSGEPS